MKSHELKTHPSYFEEIRKGSKTFECRKNDRDFKTGDLLILNEYDPFINGGIYTGRSLTCKATYIIYGKEMGVEDGYCVMSIKVSPFRDRKGNNEIFIKEYEFG